MATVAPIRSAQQIAADDGVREAHGCYVGDKPLALLSERHDRIVLIGMVSDKLLTPRQARYLARKLNRLARRIERRELLS